MKIIILVVVCLFLSGCATSLDNGTLYLLNQRIQELEGKKPKAPEQEHVQKKINIEISVFESSGTAIINMSGPPTKKFILEVIEDQNGNLIIPQDKIIKRFEMKIEK